MPRGNACDSEASTAKVEKATGAQLCDCVLAVQTFCKDDAAAKLTDRLVYNPRAARFTSNYVQELPDCDHCSVAEIGHILLALVNGMASSGNPLARLCVDIYSLQLDLRFQARELTGIGFRA